MLPRSVYIHVPFCAHRCGYCNFTVIAGRDDLTADFLKALELEMSALDRPNEVETLFIGGGTPTHLAPEDLRRLLLAVRRWFPPAAGYEWSVEANPIDVSPARVEVLSECGVTRLSLGAQSFRTAKLKLLERDHDAEQIARAVALARGQLRSVSLDLIFAAPQETPQQWAADLASGLTLSPDHVSTYGLTYERGTTFWGRLARGDLSAIEEDEQRQMYEHAIDRLTAAGFEHYEVSNFARLGHRCRHNEVYWTGRPFFAAGPGAARFVDGRREVNHQSTTTWLRRVLAGQSPVASSETLGPEDAARELLVFGLRRLEGIEREEFFAATGYRLEALAGREIQKYVDLGALRWQETHLQLTRAGLLVSDSLWPALLRR